MRADLYIPLVGFEIDVPSHALFARGGIVYFVMHCYGSGLFLFTFFVRTCMYILIFLIINSRYGCSKFLM